MARTANVFARVEPEVKEQAEQVLDRLGIPMSNAVGMFLRQIVLQRGIPFEMKLPAYEEPVAYGSLTKEQFNAEIEKGMEDIKAGRVYSADEVEAEMKQEFGIMKYKVMYTAGAKKDLRNIFRYISEELLAPENAAGQTDRIMAAIRKLDTMPNRNRLYEEEPWHSRGLRFFPVDNYLVFYKTNDENEIVYIVRIMYRGRDVRKQLSRTEDISEN